MSAIALLRAGTVAAHEQVDAAFARFSLDDPLGYGRFLSAHGLALPQAEAAARSVWPGLRPRLPLLVADLAALGRRGPPAGQPGASAIPATAWGALYVVEGSRLGGGLLAGRLGEGLPRAYLSAVHLPGEWRAIRQAIDAAASGRDEAWHTSLVDGALATFARYAAAARSV